MVDVLEERVVRICKSHWWSTEGMSRDIEKQKGIVRVALGQSSKAQSRGHNIYFDSTAAQGGSRREDVWRLKGWGWDVGAGGITDGLRS